MTKLKWLQDDTGFSKSWIVLTPFGLIRISSKHDGYACITHPVSWPEKGVQRLPTLGEAQLDAERVYINALNLALKDFQ